MRLSLLFRFELKKLFGNKTFMLLFVLFILLKVGITYLNVNTAPDPIYRMYMQHLAGALTPEKETYILEEQASIQEILNRYSEIERKHQNKKIDDETFRQYSLDYYEAKDKEKPFEKVYEKYEYFKMRDEAKAQVETELSKVQYAGNTSAITQNKLLLKQYEEPVEFFDDTGWNALMANISIDIVYVFIFIMLIIYFTNENISGVQVLNDTYRERTKLYIYKIALILCLTIILVALCISVDHIVINARYGLSNGHAPLQSLSHFANNADLITLNSGIFSMIFLRMLGSIVFVLGFILLCIKIKKPLPITFIFMILMFPSFLGIDALPNIINSLLPSTMLSGSAELVYNTFNNVLGVQILNLQIAVIFYMFLLIIIILFLLKHIKKYTLARNHPKK